MCLPVKGLPILSGSYVGGEEGSLRQERSHPPIQLRRGVKCDTGFHVIVKGRRRGKGFVTLSAGILAGFGMVLEEGSDEGLSVDA